jgi:hypothetical protein
MYNKEYGKQYRLTHQDQIKKYNKQYNLDHKEERSLYNKQYNKSDKMKNYQNKWYSEHKNQRSEQHKRYRLKNKERFLILKYKNTDNKKNLICDLTTEWLKENITSKSCIYCGEIKDIGCDRIDNTKGHIKNNVIPSCKICNIIRGFCNFSVEEMKLLGKTKNKIILARYS